MRFINLGKKLIKGHGNATAHGSATDRDEIISLIRGQAEAELKKLAEITAERDRLRTENQFLRDQLANVTTAPDFKLHNGLLWLRLGPGYYERIPYCARCKMIMHQFPPRGAVNSQTRWKCTPCDIKAEFSSPPQDYADTQ